MHVLKFIEIEQQKIVYEVIGSGTPIICLHGLNQTREIFKTNKMRHDFCDYQMILVDLPGYGDSSFIEKCEVEDIVNIIELIRKQEHIHLISLCGYCLGGVFALDYAIRYPNIVEQLVLIETMIYLPKWMFVTHVPGFKLCHDLFNGNIKLMKFLGLLPCFHNIYSPQRINLSNKTWNKNVNYHYLHMMQKYEKIDHIKRCKNICAEVKIILSKSSFRKVRITSKKLQKVISNVEVMVLNTKGHFLYLDET